MGQNPNFRGGQNRNSRGGQNGSRGGQIQKFFGAPRRGFCPPLEKILATPLFSNMIDFGNKRQTYAYTLT